MNFNLTSEADVAGIQFLCIYRSVDKDMLNSGDSDIC